MTCLSDGLLRSQIDRELEGEPLRRVEEHLLSCESCRARRAEMVEAAARVRMSLNALSPAVAGAAQDPAEAYLRFRRQISAVSKPPVFALWRKPLGGALAAGIALAFLISFAPARSWGQHILSMLRIQKVAVVPLDLSALATDTKNGGSTGKLLAQMISDSVVVTEKPGEPQTVSDVGSGQPCGRVRRSFFERSGLATEDRRPRRRGISHHARSQPHAGFARSGWPFRYTNSRFSRGQHHRCSYVKTSSPDVWKLSYRKGRRWMYFADRNSHAGGERAAQSGSPRFGRSWAASRRYECRRDARLLADRQLVFHAGSSYPADRQFLPHCCR